MLGLACWVSEAPVVLGLYFLFFIFCYYYYFFFISLFLGLSKGLKGQQADLSQQTWDTKQPPPLSFLETYLGPCSLALGVDVLGEFQSGWENWSGHRGQIVSERCGF